MQTQRATTSIPNPVERANLCSRLFYCWLNPIFKKGYKKELEVQDLYDVPDEDRSEKLGDRLEKEWRKELSQIKPGEKPKLLKALLRCFGMRFIFAGLLAFIEECGTHIIQPLFLAYLIRSYGSGDPTEQYKSYIYAAGIVLTTIAYPMTHHPYFFEVTHLGMKMRVACCSLLYRKALALSRAALNQTTVGQMVNLLSNDVNRFDTGVIFLHYLWVGPLQTLIVVCVLWSYMGPAILAGIAILLLFIPLQAFMGKIFSKFRTQTAQLSDDRIRIMNEILSAMRVIKMYAWENPFRELVDRARRSEVKVIRKVAYCRAMNMSIFFTSSKVILLLTFLTFVLTGNILTAENVFVTVSLMNAIRLIMTLFFPYAIALFAEMRISVSRLQKFMLLEDLEATSSVETSNLRPKLEDCEVDINNITASWNKTLENPTLNGISFTAKPGKLTAIIGSVGCGKTSSLMAVLGELPLSEGKIKVRGRLAYSSQESWVFAGSVQENILFGQPYDKELYNRVLHVCALDKDIQQLPFGDRTLVGDKGVSLSGGQKARVNLARALYFKADIYLLDDPLSAVDAHVGRHLFDKCIRGFLRHKVVILVTHQVQFLKEASHIVVLGNGNCIGQGNYHQLVNSGIDFASLLSHEGEEEIKSETKSKPMLARNPSIQSQSDHRRPSFYGSQVSIMEGVDSPIHEGKGKDKDENLESPKLAEESRTSGAVGIKIYLKYFRAGGSIFTLFILLLINIAAQMLYSGSDYWLKIWTNGEELKGKQMQEALSRNLSFEDYTSKYLPPGAYLDPTVNAYIYTGLVAGSFVLSLVRTMLFFWICMRASVTLHNQMFSSIIRSPMVFFDTNPVGRILNRFARDMGLMDDLLPICCFDFFEIFLNILGIFVIVASINVYIIISTVLLTIIFILLRKVYLETARDIKRLEGITRSPVFSHISASVQGLAVIRAFKVQNQFMKEFDAHQDLHSSTWFIFLAANRWLGIRLDAVSSVFIASVILALMLTTSENLGGDVGLAISSALLLSGMFQWGVRQSTEVESQMTSVERVLEYSKLKPEASLTSLPEKSPPPNWPQKGEITLNNVELFYADNEPPVLKSLSCTIKPQEKVGIVGRTGAGKSSIITALFRLTEPKGVIVIDGVSVTEIGLHDLRRKISIIPQDPILFTGSVRKNLDPFSDHKDAELWEALEEVQLKSAVLEMPEGLETKLSEGGSNFSMGQRQLVCLARAILRRNRVLILDEATANVDPTTDGLIQETIRKKFSDCTVLTIAHRLNTIMDADRILVLDAGRIMEFDEPHILLQNEKGMLYQMVQQTGHSTANYLKNVAKTNYDLKHPKEQEIQSVPESINEDNGNINVSKL